MFQERHESLCLHGGRESFSLLHLSDLHLKWSDALLVHLEEVVAAARPDAVVMTGDYFDVPAGARLLRGFLSRVARQAPVVFITGNHDHWYGRRVTAWLHGIDGCHCIDGATHTRQSPRGFTYQFHSWGQALRARRRAGCTHIGLVHNPERIGDAQPLAAIDLVLAGHLHGGQFVFFTARDTRHYPGSWLYRHCADRLQLGKDDATTLIVSRGLGDLLPLRYRCPREVVHVHIT